MSKCESCGSREFKQHKSSMVCLYCRTVQGKCQETQSADMVSFLKNCSSMRLESYVSLVNSRCRAATVVPL